MITVTLSQIADITGGERVGNDLSIESVSTDTRSIEQGALFVALVGERFDAHDFCQQAVESGAGALLVQKRVNVNVPQVVVGDSKVALGQVAAWVHQTCQTPTVAITGSCGKTTVKEMVASILQLKGKVLFTAGNFNNDIGVPLTLLRSQQDDDYAVIELGANHIGEIEYTTQLVKPDIAMVNNVAAAHLEGFGSIDGVKQAKGEIYQGL
ncbi:Mur ligase family protein, partial [Vibrio campbellii]